MSSFTDPLTVTKLYDGFWVVSRSFTYYVGSESSGDSITVPEGLITDFASIPRPFWSIMPPDGEYTQAAVLHDYLYQKHLRSRKESDDIFLEAMGVLGVPNWQRYLMYYSVRWFGQKSWDNAS